jgi:hypothetical protein
MTPLTEQGAEVVAAVAALQSERDTLLGLLRDVLAHEQFTNQLGEVVILLPEETADRIREALH